VLFDKFSWGINPSQLASVSKYGLRVDASLYGLERSGAGGPKCDDLPRARQLANHVFVAALDRRVEGGVAAGLAGVDIGARCNQAPDDLQVMAGGSAVERADALCVLRDQIRIGTSFE
jgi:hypothetical protein